MLEKVFLRDTAIAIRAYGKYFKRIEPDIGLNKKMVYEASASAYCDIYRIEAFRGIRHADVHKRAAFLSKWFVKVRPILVHRHPQNDVFQNMNELFA